MVCVVVCVFVCLCVVFALDVIVRYVCELVFFLSGSVIVSVCVCSCCLCFLWFTV